MKTIVVLGANGRVGYAVALAFQQAGFRVFAVTRSGKPIAGLEQIPNRAADAMDKTALIDACRDADFVFNGLNVPYSKWSADWPILAANVLAACEANNATQLFPGNVYGYGLEIPAMVNEGTEMTASTAKGLLRCQIEDSFQAHSDRVQTLILRSGDYFGGPQKGSWFDLVLIKNLHKKKFAYPGPTNLVHAWAYLPDVARAFVTLATNAEECQRFESFCLEGHSVTGDQLHQSVERAVGHALKRDTVPWSLYRCLGLFVPLLREVVSMRYLWDTPHQLSSAHLVSRFGQVAQTPLDQAIKQALTDQRLG